MLLAIPGRNEIKIKHVVFDFNGTIAVDGKLITGVAKLINELSTDISFHVITADTYGSVEKELVDVNCSIEKIPEKNKDIGKLEFLEKCGKENTLCVGNGNNDKLMLKESIIGIAIIQDEGVCVETLLAADIACKSIIDVFNYFKTPDRIRATLRN